MNNIEVQKEKAKQRSKKYYQKNRERILKRQKEYLKNKLATDEEYLQKLRKQKREWAKEHRKKLQEKGLTAHGTHYKVNLQQRIDDAIEYIENSQLYGMRTGKTLYSKIMQEVINILKGDYK